MEAPVYSSSSCMVPISRTSGMRFSTTGSSVSRHAAKAGSAEFLAPLTAISPSSGWPPWMRNLSILVFQGLGNSPTRGGEPGFGGRSIQVQPRHYDGGFNITAGFAQELTGAMVVYVRRSRDNPPGPVFELRVFRLHVHHQIAVNVAEPDHNGGTDHIEHQLGGRAGLHACRACDHFRTHQRSNRDFGRSG